MAGAATRIDRDCCKYTALVSFAALSVFVLTAQPTLAQTRFWDGSTSSDWFTGSNWDTNAAPTAADDAILNTIVPNPTVIGAAGAVADVVDVGGAGTGMLTVNGAGTLVAAGVNAGVQPGSNGTFIITGPNANVTANTVEIALEGTGRIEVLGGADLLTNQQFTVGGFGGGPGTGLLRGNGSSIISNDAVFIGAYGSGTLVVDQGAYLEGGLVAVGVDGAGVGRLEVTGDGSRVLHTGTSGFLMVVGNVGRGEAIVSAGGDMESIGPAVVGAFVGAEGIVTVTDTDSSLVVNGDLIIGGEAEGTLNILADGLVGVGLDAILANTGGSTGHALVSGDGSFWDIDGMLNVGTAGVGTVLVEDGGIVSTNGGRIGDAATGNGEVTVTGGGSTWVSLGELIVGGLGEGELNILNGGQAGATSSRVGVSGSSMGAITVDGEESLFIVGSQLQLGNSGSGSLDIINGAQADVGSISAGGFAGTGADILVSGTGSLLNLLKNDGIGSGLTIGSFSSASLRVEAGGQVESLDSILLSLFGTGNADVVVTGADSILRTAELFSVSTGSATILVDDGGLLAAGTSIFISGATGNAMATIRGPGSMMTAGNFIFVDSDSNDTANGTLIVEQGAVVTTGLGTLIGWDSGTGIGSVRIDGVGSRISDAGESVLGGDGHGILTIVNGGLYELGAGIGNASSKVRFAEEAGSTGVLNIGGAVGAPAAAPGTYNVGLLEIGDGWGDVNFNHTSASYTFGTALSGANAAINVVAGTTIFTADSPLFTGNTIIGDAIFRVNGSLAGSMVTVGADGTLGGSGTVGNLNVGGLFAPGNSIGTMTVNGNLVFQPGGTYEVEVASASADRTDVTGTASIAGTLRAIALGGGFSPGQQYTLISSTGALTGTFGGLFTVGSFNGLVPTVSYTSNAVLLTLVGGTSQDVDWDGSDSTDWFTAANWVSNTVPTIIDVVTINTTSPNPTRIETAGAMTGDIGIGSLNGASGSLTIAGGGTLSTDGTAEVGSNGGSGSVLVTGTGSAWSIADALALGTGPAGAGTGGRLELAQGGSVIVGGGGGSGDVTLGAAGEAAGELVLGAGAGALQAAGLGISSTGVLRFDTGSAAYTFDAVLNGNGAVSQQSGTTILTADSSGFAGTTSLLGGTLLVNGNLGGTLAVGTGATLGGSGTVGQTTVNAGGILSPGNSIGSLTVNGNLDIAANSIFVVEADPNGAADIVNVTRTATIAGGTVQVIAGSGNFAAMTDYTILSAAGGITGTFADVTSNLAFLVPTLSYDPDDVVLTLTRNTTGFGSINGTPNQIAAGTGTEALGAGNPVFDAVLPLSQPGALAAFDLLSGEVHASLKGVLASDSGLIRAALLEQLAEALDGDARMPAPSLGDVDFPPDTSLWAKAVGAIDHWTGDGNAADIAHGTGALLMGGDGLLGDWRVGLMAGIGQTALTIDARNSTARSLDYHLGVYAGRDIGVVRVRVGAIQSLHDIETQRNVAIGSFTDTLTGNYWASTSQVFGDLGYGIGLGDVDLEPFVSLAYSRISTAGIVETGGPAALNGAAQHFDALFATIGVRASGEFVVGDDLEVTVQGSLAWRHAFGPTPTAVLGYGSAAPFTVAGVPLASDSLLLSAGIDAAIAPGASVGLTYAGQFGAGIVNHSIKAGAWVEF
jgi:fibronectin-binding autotransporter adhesin